MEERDKYRRCDYNTHRSNRTAKSVPKSTRSCARSKTTNYTYKTTNYDNYTHKCQKEENYPDHEYSYKYTPTYLELNCQWVFELFKLIIGIILISILAISNVVSVQHNKHIEKTDLFKPATVFEYITIIIALLMSISIPVFYFTRTDVFVGRNTWQKILFWYNFLMFWMCLPCLVLASIMADLARANNKGKDIFLSTSARFSARTSNTASTVQKPVQGSGVGGPEINLLSIRGYLVTNAILIGILMLVFFSDGNLCT